MPSVDSKVCHCINIKAITVRKLESIYLPAVSSKGFNDFLNEVDELKKQEAKYNFRNHRSLSSTPQTSRNKHDSDKTPSDNRNQPSISGVNMPQKVKDKELKKKSPSDRNMPKVLDKSMKKIDNRKAFQSRLQKMADVAEPMEANRYKKFCEETIKMFNFLGKLLIPDACLTEDTSIRVIPEIDETKEEKGITTIEGLLPVFTTKYKKAIYTKSLKVGDTEPTVIIANFVRYAFPTHWIRNVTLKGSGGRKSLISLWNYKNPLLESPEGDSKPGLGEQRFRALLDHVVRKCGKKSYDTAVEKSLISAFAKALHYSRTRMGESKAARKLKFTSSDSDDDEDDDCSEESSEHSNMEWSDEHSGREKIVCTPLIEEYELNSDDDDVFVDPDDDIYERNTVTAGSVKDFDSQEKGSQAKKTTKSQQESQKNINEKLKESSFKQPNPKNDKESRSNIRPKNIETVRNDFYSQPASSSKRSFSDSSPLNSQSKKQKRANTEDEPRVSILSQDESKIAKKIMSQSEKEAEKKDEKESTDDGDDDIFGNENHDDTQEEGEISD